MKFTKKIFRWHHWCGLIVGLFLLMMSITGSVLVFSEEWEELEDPALTLDREHGKPSFDASLYAVRVANPGYEIRLYHMPQADRALVYELRKKEIVRKIYVHPLSGKILKEKNQVHRGFQRRLLLLHYTLWSGTTGKIIVFFVGILFLITLATGVVIYRKSILRVLRFRVRINKRSQRAKHSSWHRIIGVWSLLFNLLVVSTGLVLSGQISLNALKNPPPKQAGIIPLVSLDNLITRIGESNPDFEIHLIRIRPGSNSIQLLGREINDPSVYGNYYSSFTINGLNGEIENSLFMKNLGYTDRLFKMAGPLHFGNYGGFPVKILYSILGLSPGLLAITGFFIWLRRKKHSL